MIPAKDVVIRSPVKLAFEESSPGVFKKELIYPGTFIKVDENDKPEFRLIVDDKLIDHWVDTFDRMKDNGVDVPVPIEHSEDPEDRRGTVVALRKEFNKERGVDSLYAYVTFRKGSENLAEHSQVSLFSPPDMKDGVGNKYTRPITHVAITDYPLVPGLSRWSRSAAASRTKMRKRRLAALATQRQSRREYDGKTARQRRSASLADDTPKDEMPKDDATPDDKKEPKSPPKDVDVMDVADAIGIDYDDDAKPAEILGLIEDTVQDLADQVQELGGELPDELGAGDDDNDVDEFMEGDEDGPMDGDDDMDDVTISSKELEEIDAINSGELAAPEEDDAQMHRQPAPASRRRPITRRRQAPASRRQREDRRQERRPASMSEDVASQLVDARKVIIQGLVGEQKITPAAASRLERIYADPKKVAASRGGEDDFKSVIAALSQNVSAFRTGSRTGAQHRSDSTEKTPLVRDAEARASRLKSKK